MDADELLARLNRTCEEQGWPAVEAVDALFTFSPVVSVETIGGQRLAVYRVRRGEALGADEFRVEFAQRIAGNHDWVNATAMPILGGGILVYVRVGPTIGFTPADLFVNTAYAENFRGVVEE